MDDFERVRLPTDVDDFHTYVAEWTPDEVSFFVDDQPVKVVTQALTYPMQLMLGIYEFPANLGTPSAPTTDTKRCLVDYVRGYHWTAS